MSDEAPERVVIFRASDPTLLDMVQGMLEAEGLQPARLGRTNAALMGGGHSAFVQMISVPRELAEPARALIDANQGPRDEDALEREALAAAPRGGALAGDASGASDADRVRTGGGLYKLAVAALAVLAAYLLLR